MSMKKPRRLLVGLCLLATTMIGGFLFEQSHRAYQRELSLIERNLESQAILLAEHAQLTFAMAYQMLTEIDWQKENSGIEANRTLYPTLMTSPQIAALIVLDDEGQPRYTARKFPIPTQDFTQRDFFTAHRDGAYALVSEPFSVDDVQPRLIPVSQRLSTNEGEFAGVAMVLLDVDYFQNFYTSVSGEQEIRIGMFHRDGTALALYPEPLTMRSTTRQALKDLFAQQEAEVMVHETPVDGTRRISAYRHLERMPAVVTTSYHYQALLADLYPTFLRNGLIFLVFAAGTAGACLLLIRSTRDAYQARESELLIKRQHHETLRQCHAIARNLPNGRVFLLDQALRYVFVEGQLSFEAPELQADAMIGQTIRESYPPETSDRLEELAKSALSGCEGESEISYREHVYQVHATPLADDDGTIRRCLLLSQDITQLKQDQQKLEALNHRLQRLASSDGLLGIANRGEFDRILEREWKRARRRGEALGLLMVDVDHFKVYNDTYGHLEGDKCLKRVAAVLERAVKRPGDLVARYGGEELAVLLPGTDLDGSHELAESLQALLADEAIAFPDSPIAEQVTVSIGVAALRPRRNIGPADLIECADQALYTAKENGRNRTELDRPAA